MSVFSFLMKLFAPAKVNLSLRILGKRADGYHDLRSLMSPISTADQIDLECDSGTPDFTVTCSDPEIPCDDTNLVAVAAREFSRATGIPVGGRIHIEKKIPHGAGLGGGSSDAAAVIVGLNQFTAANLSSAKLEEIAATVGSDVAFFIRGSAAWISGRGEHVEPCALSRKFFLVMIKPPFGVSTAWAYRAWVDQVAETAHGGETTSFGGVDWVNDLEVPVFRKFILLPALRAWLLQQMETRVALMSGSGSTMFAVCESIADAETLRSRTFEYLGDCFQVWIAETTA